MPFREDLEAARARVADLEREVAAARAQRDEDRARLRILRPTLYRARDVFVRPLRTKWGWRIPLGLLLVGLLTVIIVRAVPSMREQPRVASTPPPPPIVAKRDLLATLESLPQRGAVLALKAEGVDENGEVPLHAQLRVLFVRADGKHHDNLPCESVEWRPATQTFSRSFESCDATAAPMHCKPAEVLRRAHLTGDLDFHDHHWWITTAENQTMSVTADDCPGVALE
jgi:hypothetical protein